MESKIVELETKIATILGTDGQFTQRPANQPDEMSQNETQVGLSEFGKTMAGTPHEKPKFQTSKVKFRSEPEDMVVPLPVRIWHQVEIFEDGTERHSIKHPWHGIFVGETWPGVLRNMNQALRS
jgi:hypothetical protein